MEFIVLLHRDSKDIFILGGTDDIQVLLDDSQVRECPCVFSKLKRERSTVYAKRKPKTSSTQASFTTPKLYLR